MSILTNDLPADAVCVFKGRMFEIWQWPQKMFDGSTMTFERLKRPDSVAVIAVVGERIILQDQLQPDKPEYFLSLPGGRVDTGEDRLAAAKRELLEETGYAADRWVLWKTFCPSSSMMWSIYTYVAYDCHKAAAPRLDSGEKIDVRLVTLAELLACADNPKFRNTSLVVELTKAKFDPVQRREFQKLLFEN